MDGNLSGDDISDVDWTTDDELEILADPIPSSQHTHTETVTGNMEAISSTGGSRSRLINTEFVAGNMEASSSTGGSRSRLISHFVGMGFSEKLVSKAIDENGEEDTDTDKILNSLLTYSTLKDSPQQHLSTNSDPSLSDYSDMENWTDDEIEDCLPENTSYVSERHKMLLSLANTGSLTDREERMLALANMGYTLEDVSTAMDRCGPEASVAVLTDCICAAQMAREEDCYLPEDNLKPSHIYTGTGRNKKRKVFEMKKKAIEDSIRLPNPMIGYGTPTLQSGCIRRSLPEEARGPPYFYYENVALTPKGVWDTISRFLYDIEPEFVDSKFFSACARKRGYVHNLPIEHRFPLVPLPPMTIQQAFPLSKRWWPSWDPRDKLNCIQTAIASAKLTERIRTALERYTDVPPDAVQKYVLEQCRKWNLVWVGKDKLAPLEPDEVEMLLGFPKNHTRGGGISRTDRYKSLGNSFQVDTVAYHLSVLKEIFPNGVNVLSLFTGIGGAEVALHRLGIKLKNVVSIEKSKANRDIVSSWWEQTNQTGNLIHFDDVQLFDVNQVEQLVDTIGSFDLVVGGSPCNNLAGSNRVSRDGLEGKESSLFYDYFRILDLVKSTMRRQ